MITGHCFNFFFSTYLEVLIFDPLCYSQLIHFDLKENKQNDYQLRHQSKSEIIITFSHLVGDSYIPFEPSKEKETFHSKSFYLLPTRHVCGGLEHIPL